MRAGLTIGMLLVASLAACAVPAPARGPRDPANAAAPTGRLAGAPPSLRAGVISYPDVPAVRKAPAEHHHHHHHHTP